MLDESSFIQPARTDPPIGPTRITDGHTRQPKNDRKLARTEADMATVSKRHVGPWMHCDYA